MKKITLFSLLVVFLCSCSNDPDLDLEYVLGKNHYLTMVDGDEREYYVHIPSSYDESTPLPVVFMLHGITGFGERFYVISGWKELGEIENIITVYPSSWHYCHTDNGKVKNSNFWNTLPPTYKYCENERPRNDVKFLRQIISELNQRFNVDSKRIHLVGFSNGGSMAFRCAVEMGDVLASVVESAGSHPYNSVFSPVRDLPITFQVGNSDNGWFGEGVDIPLMFFDSLLNYHPKMQRIINTHVNSFDFEPTFTVSGDQNSAMIATFKGNSNQGNRNFKFVLIGDLEHNYPNGINHPINGPKENWQWMKQFTLP